MMVCVAIHIVAKALTLFWNTLSPHNQGSPKSEREFRRLLKKLPAGAYLCDADGLITYYGQHATRL
jgi:hypothetical protein